MAMVGSHFNEPWREDSKRNPDRIVTSGKIEAKHEDYFGHSLCTPVYYDHGDTPPRSPGVGEGSSAYWAALGARVMDRGQGELPGRAPEEPPATRWEAPEIPARPEPQVGPSRPWQAGYAEEKNEIDAIGERIYGW